MTNTDIQYVMLHYFADLCLLVISSLEGVNRVVVPFLACGDLSAYDSDQTYLLEAKDNGEYKSLPPTQAPINPPYKTACYLKKNSLLATEDDSSDKTPSGSKES